jgi:hypothetical protein
LRTHKPSLLQDLLKDWGLSVGQLPRVYEAIKEFERNDGALNAVKSQTDKIKEQMLADRASALAEEQVLDREAALAEATAAWEASPFVVIAPEVSPGAVQAPSNRCLQGPNGRSEDSYG